MNVDDAPLARIAQGLRDRGWTRIVRNVDAEISCSRSLAHYDKYKAVRMTDLEQHESIQVFVGVDVGKGAHHAAR